MLNKVLKRVELYGDGKGYIEIINSSEFNASEEGRLKALSLVGICKGKLESANPSKLKEILAKEGTEANPYGRAFELIPVAAEKYLDNNFMISDNLLNNYYKFSHTGDDKIYTNYRTLANFIIDFKFDKVLKFNTPEEVKDFKVIRGKVPKFVFDHLKTHTQITSLAQSDRSSVESDYWLPDDLQERFIKSKGVCNSDINKIISLFKSLVTLKIEDFNKSLVHHLLSKVSPNQFEELFKTLGYSKEIYQRQLSGFRYKEFIMSGWINDPLTFNHLIELRSHKPTQKETIEFTEGLREVLMQKIIPTEHNKKPQSEDEFKKALRSGVEFISSRGDIAYYDKDKKPPYRLRFANAHSGEMELLTKYWETFND